MNFLRTLTLGVLLVAALQGCGGKGGGSGASGGQGGTSQPAVEPSACLKEHPGLRAQEHGKPVSVVEAFAQATRDCKASLEEITAAANQMDRE